MRSRGGARVSIGARVGAPLVDDVLCRLGALGAIAGAAGGEVDYVNANDDHDERAAVLVEAVWQYDPTLPVLSRPGSRVVAHAREAGLDTTLNRPNWPGEACGWP